MQIVLAFRVEFVRVILEQRLAETIDVAQRRAQIVRDRIREGFKFFVGSLKLRGAIGHAVLEFFIETPNLVFCLLALSDVVVDLENGFWLSVLVAMQNPVTGNHDLLAIFSGVN